MAYLPLSTANLPNPVIDPATGATPDQYFNTVLYPGNSSTNAVTGVGFQPDFTWTKVRNTDYPHNLFDAVRGATYTIQSQSTAAEVYAPISLTSFDSDGFTLGSAAGINESSRPYVAWNWKANGSGTSIAAGSIDGTNPTIASTVSANTTSGFSIVSWTGNETDGATVGHGLSQEPDLAIIKNRTDSTYWYVKCNPDTNPAFSNEQQYLYLNDTLSIGTSSFNQTTLTADTIQFVDSGNDTNGSGDSMIAYCFHSVEGFSKFGSYTGNGSADGPFVYTGFRPSWIMIKSSSNASTPWQIFDATRETFNTVEQSLIANGANAEPYDTASPVDFLSNGFKLRGGASSWNNYNTGTWIYACFSEQPFKYSNAR